MLKIKEIREAKRMSQDEVVRLTGIPKRSYVNYENGKTDIPVSKLQNIASVLNVKVQDFIEEQKIDGKTDEALQEPGKKYDEEVTLLSLKKDLKTIYDGLTTNFNTISEGVFHILQDTQEIKHFIDELDPKAINNASQGLNKFLEEHK